MVKFCAIVLTYADRRRYLFKTVDRLILAGLDRVILVCNGVDDYVFRSIEEKYSDVGIISIMRSQNNLGSAGGYSYGMKNIPADIDYFALVDDDNLFPIDALSKIQNNFHEKDDIPNDSKIHIILRRDRKILDDAIRGDRCWLPVGKRNSCFGVNIFDAFSKVEKTKSDLIVAPYSGLVFPRKIVDDKEWPKEEMYLYSDDYEFVYRLVVERGYIVKCVEDAEIVDLETSYNQKKKKKLISCRYLDANDIQLYYSIRNERCFSMLRCDNKIFYELNYWVSIAYFLFVFLCHCKFSKVTVLFRAVWDSVRGSYGKKRI